MNPDSPKYAVDDVEDVVNGWIETANVWAAAIREYGPECKVADPYEELLRDLDYLIEKSLPSYIERVKFLAMHECQYEHMICVHCGDELV
jgi:hypothetical protein